MTEAQKLALLNFVRAVTSFIESRTDTPYDERYEVLLAAKKIESEFSL